MYLSVYIYIYIYRRGAIGKEEGSTRQRIGEKNLKRNEGPLRPIPCCVCARVLFVYTPSVTTLMKTMGVKGALQVLSNRSK